ncbi:allantoinase AllB [Naumannella halotolerans]|uniref:allantoinase n=1 Tax=Naumannella halotolerans TaxID=993414 RepID=A0A4R7J7Z6_9ACTN|nr:allantoinase AllB [Naumannella halotolerans]TDT33592.1 allantoinase [Naumannella halotolerans]
MNVAPASVAAPRVYLNGTFSPATVVIENGTIAAITPFDPGADLVLDPTAVLLPGLVDSHVHLDEPGRTEWEGFATGTAAAAAAGITTVVDMPLNSVPVTTTPQALAVKRAAAVGKLAADVGYWGGAVPENLGHLSELAAAGVVGFKCFLSPSGIDEFGHLDQDQLLAALTELAEIDATLIVHAEDPAELPQAGPLGRVYADFLDSRPDSSEISAIGTVIEAASRTGARVHIVHLASAEALPLIRQAKTDGVRLSVETCPHYLTLFAEEVPDGAAAFKCCPPIRGGDNADLLWEALLDGTIDAVVSDHSPSTRQLKDLGDGDFGLAWGGIAGLQTGFSAVWTAARERGIVLERLLPLFTTGPAMVADLHGLGVIEVGAPANLAIFEPDTDYVVDAEELQYRNPISPWDGTKLSGLVSRTLLHGRVVYDHTDGVLERNGREILLAPAAASKESPV